MSVRMKEVRRRIRAAREIGHVSGALQKVAAARLAQDRRALAVQRRYAETLERIVQVLQPAAPDLEHELLARHRTGRELLVVLGAERGLCGGHNRVLAEQAEAFCARRPDDRPELLVVGRATGARLRAPHYDVRECLRQPPRSDAARAETVEQVMSLACDGFTQGAFREVHLLYTRFETSLRQVPVLERLLPFAPPAEIPDGYESPALFEPGADEILSRLLPLRVRVRVAVALLNETASENAARQTAMTRASDNARQVVSGLTRSYRRLRQESITTEMLELVGGKLA